MTTTPRYLGEPGSIQEMVREGMVRRLVGLTIACPFSHEILDVRTCVVILDGDGDPSMVLSPAGAVIASETGALAEWATWGILPAPQTAP